MILAGIDEAGYGPLLGPLVVGCSAFELPDADPACEPLPCLWKRLNKLVGKSKSRSGKKIHVNDSKLVYSPATGLKELERAVLAIATTWDQWNTGLADLLAKVAPDALTDVTSYPWYEPDGDVFPIEQDATSVRLLANGLKAEMGRTGTPCVHLAARVVFERQFNRMVGATRNKASVLFSIAAIHLDRLIRAYGDRGLVVFCDRQGGRSHYGQLLRLMFDDWALEITRESDERSDYRLLKGPHVVRVIFAEKAEAQCMSVAVASMLSKYLREALMRRFNAYWRKHLPDIEPTAGYYGDGTRFLGQIDVKRRELGVPDEQLIRSR